MSTLEELIEEGLRIRERRVANELKRREEAAAREERERAEATERILALLPEPVRPLAEVKFPNSARLDHARVHISLPKGGEVIVYVERENDCWHPYSDEDYYRREKIVTYAAWSPAGYFSRFFYLEEALAYAAGAFEV